MKPPKPKKANLDKLVLIAWSAALARDIRDYRKAERKSQAKKKNA